MSNKPKRGRPRTSDAPGEESSRDKLICAAAQLFARHGFVGVSTTMVADAANLTQPMVYYCFRSKRLLWEAVVEHLFQRRERFPVESRTLVDLTPLSRLRLLVSARFEANVAEPYLGMVVLHEALSESSRLDWTVGHYSRPAFEAMKAAAQAAIDAAQIRHVSLPNLCTLLGSAGYLSFAFASISDEMLAGGEHHGHPSNSVRESFVKVLFEGLSVRPPPTRASDPLPQVQFAGRTGYRDVGGGGDPLERLIRAGGALFARDGFEGVTTGRIASEAGLSQSMVNYYFNSKEQFWKAVVDRLVEQRREMFVQGRMHDLSLSPLTRLKMFVRMLIAANARQPEFGRIFLQEALHGGERLIWLKQRYFRATFGAVEEIGRAAVAAGEMISLPPGHLSNILVSTTYHVFGAQAVIRRLCNIDLLDDAAIAGLSDDVVTILFDGLKT